MKMIESQNTRSQIKIMDETWWFRPRAVFIFFMNLKILNYFKWKLKLVLQN